MQESGGGSSESLLIALKHPLRRKILRHIQDNPRCTPKQIAKVLGEPLSNCSYHCRVLRDQGAIRLIDQKPVRGAIQNHYDFAITDAWALAILAQEGEAPDLDP